MQLLKLSLSHSLLNQTELLTRTEKILCFQMHLLILIFIFAELCHFCKSLFFDLDINSINQNENYVPITYCKYILWFSTTSSSWFHGLKLVHGPLSTSWLSWNIQLWHFYKVLHFLLLTLKLCPHFFCQSFKSHTKWQLTALLIINIIFHYLIIFSLFFIYIKLGKNLCNMLIINNLKTKTKNYNKTYMQMMRVHVCEYNVIMK